MTATAENGWELSVTRLINAPPVKVWDIMTNRINEWWCPTPWRAEFDNLERRAGGASSCTMYGPDGEVHPHPGLVLAWDEGRRFALTDAVVGEGTRYTATCRHWTEEACNNHVEMGFTDGWGACADQLVALCEA